MKFIDPKTQLLSILFMCVSICHAKAQTQNNTANQNFKFDQLLEEKRKINVSIVTNDTYKIQIFTGSSENAKKNLMEFRQEFKDIQATIVFNTPNYKVWVGNFKTRIEAERFLINVKNKYKNVLLIKPSK